MTKLQFIKLLLAINSFAFLISCVSFKNKFPAIANTTIQNTENISGTYYAIGKIEVKKFPNSEDSINFLLELDRKILQGPIFNAYLDTFSLQVISDNELKILAHSKHLVTFEWIIEYEKRDNFLYLQNKNFGVGMIPYLFGGIDIKKIRISLTSGNDLYVEEVSHVSGAVLVIGFFKFKNDYFNSIFKRV